jgi:hypothetical protein
LAVWRKISKYPTKWGGTTKTGNTRTPCRVAEIDHFIAIEVIISTQKKRSEVVRAGPGDRLHADDKIVGNGWGVMSQYQPRRARYIFGKAGDGEVLVIERRVTQEDVRSL